MTKSLAKDPEQKHEPRIGFRLEFDGEFEFIDPMMTDGLRYILVNRAAGIEVIVEAQKDCHLIFDEAFSHDHITPDLARLHLERRAALLCREANARMMTTTVEPGTRLALQMIIDRCTEHVAKIEHAIARRAGKKESP